MVELSKEQEGFIPWIRSQRSRCLILTGHAGTGKTTVMGLLEEKFSRNKIWCAPSHNAKNILSSKVGVGVITIAKALGLMPKVIKGRKVFLPSSKSLLNEQVSLVVIDEASMVSTAQLNWLLASGARQILFVGDPAQLPPVKEDIAPVFLQNFPKYELTKVFRQKEGDPILDLATDTRGMKGNTAHKRGVKVVDTSGDNIAEFYKRYPDGIAVCSKHTEKDLCNKIAKNIFTPGGWNSDNAPFSNGEMLFLESPICPPEGPTNGSRVKIVSEPGVKLFKGFKVWCFNVAWGQDQYPIMVPDSETERKSIERKLDHLAKHYKALEQTVGGITEDDKNIINKEVEDLSSIVFASLGFAMTIHKAQGSTFEDVFFCSGGLFGSGDLRTKLAYTAITRASRTLILGI